MAKVGKRLQAAYEKTDATQLYSLSEAIKLVKANATSKFDETIDLAINLGIDPKHSDQMVRGVIGLPSGTGKDIRVAVIANDNKVDEAKKAGADIVGNDDLIEEIGKGKIDFDRCIATPDMMAKIGQVARVLGPKGLMPNPKLGTVTNDISDAVKDAKSGQVEFRAEKAGIVHVAVGKASFTEDALLANIKALIDAIVQAKPSGAKGTYVKAITLTSTMGPGVHLDVTALLSDKK